jgi:hypothetical protein
VDDLRPEDLGSVDEFGLDDLDTPPEEPEDRGPDEPRDT